MPSARPRVNGSTLTAALLADMTARGEVRFDDPVGTYLPPGVTVPTRGGRQITLLHLAVGKALFAQATGQPNSPVYAESDTSFFYKVVDAQLTFTRDTTGKVTAVVLHQAGRQIPGRKTH